MNLNVIRTLTIRSKVEGAEKTQSDLKGIHSAHEGVARASDSSARGQLSLADAVARSDRQFSSFIRSQMDFERTQRGISVANDNLARTFHNVEAAMGGLERRGKGGLLSGLENALGIGKLGAFNKEMNAIGLTAPVVTGVLKQTRDGFVQIQNAASDGTVASHTFAQGLDAIDASAEPATRSASNLVTQLSLITGAGIIAGALALYKHFKDLTTQIAEMGEVAKRTIPDVERFQQVRFAAGVSGLSGKDFDKGLNSMAEDLNKARRDTNDLTKLLDANNIKYKEGNTLLIDTNRLLTIGADLVKRASSEQDKFKIAEMLGLTKEWVPFLEKGSVALEQGADEASRLGVVIDASIIKKAKEFDDEWKRSSAQVSAYIRAWLAESIPLIDQFINKGGDWVKTVADAVKSSTAGMPDVSQSAGGLSEILTGLRRDLGGTKSTSEEVESAIAKVIGKLELFGVTIFDLTPKIKESVSELARLRSAFEDIEKFNSRDNAAEGARESARSRALGGLPIGARTIVPPKDEKETRDAWERAITTVDKHIAAVRADTIAIGLNVGEHAALRAEFSLLEAAKVADKDVTDEQIEAYTRLRASMSAQQALTAAGIDLGEDEVASFDRITKAVNEATIARERARVADRIKFDRDTLLLSPENVQIAQQLKGLYPDVATALGSSEAAAMRLNNNLKFVLETSREIGSEILKGVVHALMEGKNVGEALSATLKNLSMRLADKAIENLLSGDFTKAAISGISAIATFIGSKLTDNSADKALEEAKRKFADMSNEVRNFNAAADGFELSQFVTAIQQITRTGIELIKAAMAAGDTAAAIQLIHNGVRQINNQVDQFIRPRGNTVADQIAAVHNEAQQIIGELNAMNQQYGLGLDRTAEILGAATDRVAEIQRKAQEEIEKRRLTFQDRVFDAANDNSTLAGARAEQQRRFDRELLDEEKVNNDARLDLLAAHEAEKFALEKSFRDRETEEIRRAREAQLAAINGSARTVAEFLQGLVSGPSATVSPLVNLANSQQLYNANLPLAQGNPLDQATIDATNKFPQLADNLEKAARAVFASAQGYQDIKNQIIAQGLALPAVQQTTDPVVQAIRDSIIAIQATTTAVGVTTVAVDADRVATSLRLDTSITRFDTQITRLSTVITDLGNIYGETVNGNTFLNTMNAFTMRIVNAINNLGGMSAIAFSSMDTNLARIRSGTDYIASHQNTPFNPGFAVTTAGATPVTYQSAATGGWINGGIPGRDSVPIMAMPREFVINADATRALTTQFGAGIMETINAGRLPSNVIPFPAAPRGFAGNDNSEIRALRQELAELRKELKEALSGNGPIAKTTAAGAVHVREGVNAVQRDTGEMKRAANMRH